MAKPTIESDFEVSSSDATSHSTTNKGNNEVVTWQLVAQTIDRMFFAFFSTMVILGTVVLFPFIVKGGQYSSTLEQLPSGCHAIMDS